MILSGAGIGSSGSSRLVPEYSYAAAGSAASAFHAMNGSIVQRTLPKNNNDAIIAVPAMPAAAMPRGLSSKSHVYVFPLNLNFFIDEPPFYFNSAAFFCEF